MNVQSVDKEKRRCAKKPYYYSFGLLYSRYSYSVLHKKYYVFLERRFRIFFSAVAAKQFSVYADREIKHSQ